MDTDAVRPLVAMIDAQAVRLDALVSRLDAQARTASLQSVRIERLEAELGRLVPEALGPRARSWSRATT